MSVTSRLKASQLAARKAKAMMREGDPRLQYGKIHQTNASEVASMVADSIQEYNSRLELSKYENAMSDHDG